MEEALNFMESQHKYRPIEKAETVFDDKEHGRYDNREPCQSF
jgi:hypothetical protein